MLQAAATAMFLALLWVIYTQRLGQGVDAALALGAAAACVAISGRFAGLTRGKFGLGLGRFALERAPASLQGASSVVTRALAADVTLKPALVQLRARVRSDAAWAACAEAAGAAPGAIVVEAGPDHLLAHVLDEDSAQVREMAEIEIRAAAAVGERLPQ